MIRIWVFQDFGLNSRLVALQVSYDTPLLGGTRPDIQTLKPRNPHVGGASTAEAYRKA